MKDIAIVTGASQGLGAAFVRLIANTNVVDEIWAIARHAGGASDSHAHQPTRIIPLCCDLTTREGREKLSQRLNEQQPRVNVLINNAGMAKFGPEASLSPLETERMLSLNCIALSPLCSMCIPFMEQGGRIINIASIASFLPVPNMGVYAATKAYVLRYSLALRHELSTQRIGVTTVCPGWMDTAFIPSACKGKTQIPTRFVGITTPEKVAAKAWRDAQRNRKLSVYGVFPHLVHWAARVLPHNWLIACWKFLQGKSS